jgi:hypothetical protein
MITNIEKHEVSENGKSFKVRFAKVRTEEMTMDVYVVGYSWDNGNRIYHKTNAFETTEDAANFYNKKVSELNVRLFNK